MKTICCFISFFWVPWCHAQGFFTLTEDKPLSFKFEMVHHLILVPVTINGIEFCFLMDTGVKETILFANTEDSLYLHNQQKVRFQGIGMEEGVDGIISNGNIVNVGGIAVDSLHLLYVVQGEDMDISSRVGVGINGILGARFFNSFPVKVDYIRSRFTIYPPGYDYSRVVRKYQEIPIELQNDRLYIDGKVQVADEWIGGKMLLDMGNADAFMLFAFLLPELKVREPYVEEYIGQGFNGPIYGKRNRIRKVSLHGIEFDYPIVAYPDSNSVYVARFASGRIGSIGNQSLQCFHLFMDYKNNRLYLRKNKQFGKPFLLNMAGINVKHDGLIWTKEEIKVPAGKSEGEGFRVEDMGIAFSLINDHFQYKFALKPIYKIEGVRKDSPAAQVGVKDGDTLLRINGIRTENLTLAKILSKFHTKPGDEVRLLLQRGDEKINVRFHLMDPVPYKY